MNQEKHETSIEQHQNIDRYNLSTPNKYIKTRSKRKHLEEYYENHVNETLPKDYHRGDITSSNRVLAFSDAVMATCATFLVLPIRNLKKKKETQGLSEFIESVYLEFIIYFLGFYIVLSIWENINIRAIVIKRIDDNLLKLMIFEMLTTTILPFSLALQGNYPKEKTSVLMTCVILGFLQIIDISIVLYATRSPKLLHVDLKLWEKNDLKKLVMIMVFKPLVSLVVLTASAAFSLIHYSFSWTLMSLMIFMPMIRRLYWFIRRRSKRFQESEKDTFLEHFSKGNISKERIEIMSDAAVAIVACILILDITVEEFPKIADVNEHGLNYVLKHMTSEFLAFLSTFAMIAALWYVNHATLHLIKTMNFVMLYFHKVFLSLCCLCPLAGNMILRFASKGNRDSNIAIRFSATIVFLSSIANLIIYLYGLLTGEKYFYRWASIKFFKKNKRQHLYNIAKAINIPFWSLVCVIGSVGSSAIAAYVLYVTFLASHCSFFVLKNALMNHVGKTTDKEIFLQTPFSKEINAKCEVTKASLQQKMYSCASHDVVKNENIDYSTTL